MPIPTTESKLKGLMLSAVEVRELTSWSTPMIEDYLNLLDNLITLASSIDTITDKKIEEIDTDFIDSSVPFVEGNLLVEDAGLQWNNVIKVLKITNTLITGLTASRLLSTDANKNLVSISNFALWITGTANRISVTDDGDGTITLSTPQDTHTGSSPTFVDVTLTGLTASLLTKTDAGKKLVSVVKQSHIVDAVAVSAISADVGADTIDRAAFNILLGTLVTEINAIKTVVNSILVALETALITETV